MDLGMSLTYHLKVSAVELRLINAALRCNLSDAQKAEALALSDALCEQRIKQSKQALVEIEKLEKNLNA
jgi:hypothetical protein